MPETVLDTMWTFTSWGVRCAAVYMFNSSRQQDWPPGGVFLISHIFTVYPKQNAGDVNHHGDALMCLLQGHKLSWTLKFMSCLAALQQRVGKRTSIGHNFVIELHKLSPRLVANTTHEHISIKSNFLSLSSARSCRAGKMKLRYLWDQWSDYRQTKINTHQNKLFTSR